MKISLNNMCTIEHALTEVPKSVEHSLMTDILSVQDSLCFCGIN